MNQTRRTFLKNSTALAASSLAVNLVGYARNTDHEIIGHGAYRYRVNKEWGVLDPAKTPVFNCHEMVKDSKGRLIMINDEVKNNILVYDKSGKLLDSWGTRYPGGHGLTLAPEGGEDALFITDCGYFFRARQQVACPVGWDFQNHHRWESYFQHWPPINNRRV
ncbi:hypothetical protein [Spirosoma telluris]|uniref:hypothetical protein n=1 Tax=Spirosoma telluris TaxID=2183553 RepID=UPI002FC2D2F4